MFQVVLMLLLATNYIPVVVNHLLMAFYSARVPFTCQVCVNYRVSYKMVLCKGRTILAFSTRFNSLVGFRFLYCIMASLQGNFISEHIYGIYNCT